MSMSISTVVGWTRDGAGKKREGKEERKRRGEICWVADYSAFLEALVRSFIKAYTSAYDEMAKMATTAASRHP